MEKKEKMNLIIKTIIIVILAEALVFGVYKGIKTMSQKHNLGINEISETSYTIPSFNAKIYGSYNYNINKDTLSDLKIYSFKATIQTGDKYETSNYIGVRVLDVFNKLNITEFKSVEFNSAIGSVIIDKADLTENEFFVFKINDEEMSGLLCLVSTDKQGQYSIPYISSMALTPEQ